MTNNVAKNSNCNTVNPVSVSKKTFTFSGKTEVTKFVVSQYGFTKSNQRIIIHALITNLIMQLVISLKIFTFLFFNG